MRCLWFIVRLSAACLLSMAACAAPYVPGDGAQVIERLPSRYEPAQQELRRLRASLAASPGNLRLAVELARRYIEIGRSEGDPRYLGYAQAALAPWWSQPQAPVEVRILRATLLQSRHQFSHALAELNAVLKVDDRNAQAWLTRATILRVQGDYRQARNSCSTLYALASELVAVVCMADVASLNGQAAQSYALLKAALGKSPSADPGIRTWALTSLAEMAARQGDADAAQHHFRQALALGASDLYLLGVYADFLLDQNRPAEVVPLLKNRFRIDGLLLRYALALKRLGSPDAAVSIDALHSRFAAAMLRGDATHAREQARFELELLDRPLTAMRLAQQNWQTQREPPDARILLEAAVANHDKPAAEPVLTWLKRTGIEDPVLQTLAAKLGGVE